MGKETLGQRLARIRKERGYTQRELADKIGIIQSIVSADEKEKLRLTAEMAIRFATALDVSTDDLLRPHGTKPLSRKPSLKVLRRMKQIESLPPARQSVVLKTIDAFVRASER
ncbi:MAG: helix-turn-helix domain-containing protein [Bryobacteraceae bacterium]